MADVRVFLGVEGQRNRRFQEGGNLVLRDAVVAYLFVLGTIAQAHEDGMRAAVGHYGILGGRDLRRGWITQVGKEDPLPARGSCAGTNILHVEHIVLEIFVEDARLNLNEAC